MNEVQDPKNFFGCLFDLSFSQFIVPKIIKLLYIIAIVLAAIGALMILFGGLASGSVASGLGGIIIAPIAFVLYVIGARIWLELNLVMFRIAENTGRMAGDKPAIEGEQEAPATEKPAGE